MSGHNDGVRTRAPRPVTDARPQTDPAVAAILDELHAPAAQVASFGTAHPIFGPSQGTATFGASFETARFAKFSDPSTAAFSAPPAVAAFGSSPATATFGTRAASFGPRPGTGNRTRRVIHHTTVVPPRRERRRTGARFVLPAEDLHFAYEEANGDHVWSPGDGIDFDNAGVSAALTAGCDGEDEHGDPRGDEHSHPLDAVLLREGQTPFDLVDLGQYFCEEGVATDLWDRRLRGQLLAVRAAARADPRAVFDQAGASGGSLARAALRSGGLHIEPGLGNDPDLIEVLLAHMDDPSILAAFADIVALRSPQLVGQAGVDLQRTLTEIGERDIWLHHPDLPAGERAISAPSSHGTVDRRAGSMSDLAPGGLGIAAFTSTRAIASPHS